MRAKSVRKTLAAGMLVGSLLSIASPVGASALVGCQGGDFADQCSLAELSRGGWIKAGRAIFQDFNVYEFSGQSEILVTPVEYRIGDSWFGELRFQRFAGTSPVATINRNSGMALNVRSDDEAVFRSYWAQLQGSVVPAGQDGIVLSNLSIIEQPRANGIYLSLRCGPDTSGATCPLLEREAAASKGLPVTSLLEMGWNFDVNGGSSVDAFALRIETGVPEPSSLVLTLSAMLCLAACAGRRRFLTGRGAARPLGSA